MGKLVFRVEADWEEVVRLRNEIEKLKSTLKNMDSTQSPAAFKTLNTQLAASTQRMDELVTSAAKAGAEMENGFKKKIFDASQSVNGFTEKIIVQKNAIGTLQTTIRKNKELYKTIVSRGGEDKSLLNHIREQEKALGKERDALFKLTQEQANARLSVKKLRDEYALYKNDGKQVIETTNGIAISWKKALGVIGGAAAINKFISDLVNVRGEFQKTQISFETMLGSKEKADKLMAQMVETAAKTPFDLQGVADGAKQLLAYGTEAKDVNDTLIRLGNIASGLSIPLGDMVYLYGTTQTQGRLFTQDVRQFMGRGIPLVKELATMLGKTEEEINKMVTAGQIGFPQVEAVIKKMTDEGGKFYNLMEKQSETLSGQISNLGDAWDRMLNSIGEDTQGLTSKTISMATSIVENYETVGKVLAGLIATYGTYRTAVMLVTAAESKHTLVEIGLTNVRVMARKAQLALNAAMLTNPYVLLAVAVGGLITVNLTLLETTRQLKAVEDDYNKTKDEAIAKERKLKAETDKNLSVAENYKAATEDRKDALVRLIQKYPAIFEKYKTETEMLQHILDIHKEIDKYEKNKSVTNPQNELANVNKQIADLEKLAKQRYHGGRGLTNAENTKLEMLKNKRSELEGSLKKEETDAILADLTGYSNSQIEAAIKDRERLLAKMQLKGVSKGTITGNSFLSVTFSKEELEGQKKLLEVALVKPSTYKQDLAKAKEDWEKAKKGYETLLNDQKATSEQVKNARNEMQAKEKSYKDLGGITGSSLSKQENQAEKLRQQTEKYNLLLDKQALEQKRSAEDLQMKVDEARIKAMDEGSKKTIAQMELNFEKEMHAIDRQKEDALRKKIEDARAAWEANPKNKGKSFDATGIKLSDDESKYFDELYKVAIISFEKGKKELSDKQIQAWQEYFIEFGNYQEKRKNLIQKYDDEIAKLQSDSPEYAIKVAEKNQAVEQLDEQFGKSAKAMADLFEDASNKSVSAIQSIIDKYEMLIKYMSGSDKDITIGDLKDIGFTDKDIENIENGKISIKDITDAIKGLKDELKGKSPWLSFKSDIDKGVDAIKKAGGDSKKVGQGITDIGNAITSFSPALKEFGADIANIFGIDDSNIQSAIDGISGLGQTASGIGQIMSGDIVGGVMSAVSGISQVVNAMGSLFGSDGTAYYEKIKEQLEAINSVYDRIIDKSKENITFGGGFTSIDAASTALDNYEKKLLNLQKIADASGRAGASWNHHSAEWHSNKNVGSDNFAQMSEIIGKSIKSMDDLYYLSGDELYLLMSQMPEAWSAIDSRIRENLESIVDCKDEANELKDALNEAITGVSYDSFYSGFIDQLSNMETSYEDMCDNFEEYLRKSMMAGLVAGQYKDQIRKLYDSWVAAGSDQNYTKEEIQELRNARDELLQSMITERDNMAEIFGWESSSSTSQSSTSRGFGTEMTHEDAGELSGRFTALQIAGEEIKNQNIKQTDLLSSINEKISLMDLTNENIPQLVANVPDFAGQTKEIATNSYQPQVNVIFPDVKIDVLTAEVSTLKGIVDEMRTFQIEKFTDVAEGVIKDSINNNIKKAL